MLLVAKLFSSISVKQMSESYGLSTELRVLVGLDSSGRLGENPALILSQTGFMVPRNDQ